MSSPSRVSAAALVLLLALAACDRETRDYRGEPVAETGPNVSPRQTAFDDGVFIPNYTDPRAASYEGNAYHVSQGARLYQWMNCVGCHANGGGGMGPPLMDEEWRYGGSMEQIAATIVQGRPNGMPAWRGRLTEQQVWQLAAFVRAMSIQTPKDVLPGRDDSLSDVEPRSLDEQRPIVNVDPKADERTGN